MLDFTTREARQAVCRDEVELNRRLAPDVYMGVADVFGPDGQPCEHLVVMRRMPDERRLAAMVRAGEPVAPQLRQVARMLASMHARARHSAPIDRQGTRDAQRSRWASCINEVRALPGAAVDADTIQVIECLVRRFLDGREALFAGRIADGRVVEGHGDLLAEDIFCLDDGPRILDCLEFDERLRSVDGLDDAAFLAMDLERLGAPELAQSFLRWYAEFSGDPSPPSLWHHYVAYRAFVRAKLACQRKDRGDPDAAWEAHDLARVTLRHLQAGAVTLILVGGFPSRGRSALATTIGERLGYAVLNGDRIRAELACVPPEELVSAPLGEAAHTPERTRRTYGGLLARAETLLRHGEPVILDAPWANAEQRAEAKEIAQRTFSDVVELHCVAAPRAITELPAGDVSGADEAIATATAPWPEAVEIDSGSGPDHALERALMAIHARWATEPWRFRRPQMEPD